MPALLLHLAFWLTFHLRPRGTPIIGEALRRGTLQRTAVLFHDGFHDSAQRGGSRETGHDGARGGKKREQ